MLLPRLPRDAELMPPAVLPDVALATEILPPAVLPDVALDAELLLADDPPVQLLLSWTGQLQLPPLQRGHCAGWHACIQPAAAALPFGCRRECPRR